MMTMALPLSASLIIIFSFSCKFFKARFCFSERLFFVIFSFRLIFHNFSKNVFSSLLLFLSGKNLVLFFTRELSVSFLFLNISISLIMCLYIFIY